LSLERISKFFHHRNFIIFTFVILTIGFVFSRVIYSCGLLFAGLTVISNFSEALKGVKDKWFLCSLSIPLIILLREGATNIFAINLALPLYILYFNILKNKDYDLKAPFVGMSLILLATALLATIKYLSNVELAISNYKIAKVIEIGRYNDHVRISIAIALSIALALHFALRSNKNAVFCYLIGYTFVQYLFLHFLAARTGLISLYVVLFIIMFHYLIVKRKIIYLYIGISLLIIPLISYKVFPSFYHRVGYTLYDYSYYKDLNYREGSSDGVRFYSIMAGYEIFKDYPMTGVGFSKLTLYCKDWYKEKFPQMPDSERMLPHNQYISYAASSGIIGLFVLLMFYFYPFYDKNIWKNVFSIAIIISIILISLVDVFLDSHLKMFPFAIFLGFAVNISKT
jgi:O-antigen ligase